MEAAETKLSPSLRMQARCPSTSTTAQVLAASFVYCLSASADRSLAETGTSPNNPITATSLPVPESKARNTEKSVSQPDSQASGNDYEDTEEDCS